MFAALWRLLWGKETTPERNIVILEDIPTWTDLYDENKQNFADTLSGIEESLQYTEDPEINRKVSIFGADMTSLAVDGVVRSTNTSLTSADGISGAIKRAAGPKLDAELKTLGGCQPGEAKTTSGFDLPADYIVHTVGTNREKPEILERCYKGCLEQMRLKKMKSLAFCCISTGIHGYPNDKAVLVALKTVRVWLDGLKTENKLDEIDRIVFCLFSDEDQLLYSIWMQIFFPSAHDSTPIVRRQQVSSPEEEEATSDSDTNSEDNIETSKDSIQPDGRKVLRRLPGFIKLTTQPDMISLDAPNTKHAKMPCGHVIGSESMKDYCLNILDNGKFKFICPTLNCKCEWEYFLVRHVACLTDEEMQEFEKKLEYNFLQWEKGNQMCPGCKTWCMKATGAGNRVRCPFCTTNRGKKFDFCWACLKEWKRFLSSGLCGNPGCDGKDKRIHTLASCSTKRINLCMNCPCIRGCPRCGLLIEHQDKCGHMSCRSCHCKFCFICLMVYKDGESKCNFLGTCKPAPRQVPKPGN